MTIGAYNYDLSKGPNPDFQVLKKYWISEKTNSIQISQMPVKTKDLPRTFDEIKDSRSFCPGAFTSEHCP